MLACFLNMDVMGKLFSKDVTIALLTKNINVNKISFCHDGGENIINLDLAREIDLKRYHLQITFLYQVSSACISI